MRSILSIIVVYLLVVAAVITLSRLGALKDNATSSEVGPAVEVATELALQKEPEPATYDVFVKFSGAEMGEQIIAGLFNSEKGFGKRENPFQRRETTKTSEGDAACQFTGLPPGSYVISAFQDSNGNSKLDKNGFGMPKEKYGFSNNARGRFGPPKYLDCEFEVSDASVVEIKLR